MRTAVLSDHKKKIAALYTLLNAGEEPAERFVSSTSALLGRYSDEEMKRACRWIGEHWERRGKFPEPSVFHSAIKQTAPTAYTPWTCPEGERATPEEIAAVGRFIAAVFDSRGRIDTAGYCESLRIPADRSATIAATKKTALVDFWNQATKHIIDM